MEAGEPFQPKIGWVEEDQAQGELAEIYKEISARPGRTGVPQILKCFSARPDFLRQVTESSATLHFSDGHLTRVQKETIATYVSALNRCPY